MRRKRAPRQLELIFPATHGGRRAGAGRKPRAENVDRPLVPHRARAPHVARWPVHVTLRAVREVGSLRSACLGRVLSEVVEAVADSRFQVVHFARLRDHVHLLVEADGEAALGAGLRRFAIRFARGVNRALGRRGRVLRDRHHRRPLTTPREVRHALVYLFTNARRHGVRLPPRALDPCSSAKAYLDGRSPAPRTWLLARGPTRAGAPLTHHDLTR